MQFGLYMRTLNVVQRVICFEKKTNPQINYKWKQVWDSLFLVIKFISNSEMFRNPEIIQIATEITTIFNLFITYGDGFLGDASDYDELYYEMIHQTKTLTQFHNVAEGTRTCNTLLQMQENISTIVRHFGSRFDQWQSDHPTSTLTQDRVIEIIKDNYSSLKLNLFDGLDHYERYTENPKEIPFFKQYVRMVIFDTKALVRVENVEIKIL